MGKENHGNQASGADVHNSSNRLLPKRHAPIRRITIAWLASKTPTGKSMDCCISHRHPRPSSEPLPDPPAVIPPADAP